MIPLAELTAAAYQSERVASRRLARRDGIAEELALRRILDAAAGPLGLDVLVERREAAQRAESARRALKRDRQLAALAQKQSRHAGPATPWRGWFDGSAWPNPGRCGIGAVLLGPCHERVEIARAVGFGNSGQAEYLALIALLEAALEAGAGMLTVYGDSRVVIDDAAGPGGASGLEEYRAKVLALMARLPGVSLRWIPRHKNSEADALAQRARST